MGNILIARTRAFQRTNAAPTVTSFLNNHYQLATTGSKIPNWKSFIRANGYPPQSSYARVETDHRPMLYRATVTDNQPFPPGPPKVACFMDGCGYVAEGGIYSLGDVNGDARVTAALNRCIAKANAKTRDQKVGWGETLAEAEKTVDMVASTARRIADAFRYVKRGRFIDAAHALGCDPAKSPRKPARGKPSDMAASNWLAFRYGWLPLLSTVNGQLEWLYDQALRRDIVRVSAKESVTIKSSLSGTQPPSSAFAPVEFWGGMPYVDYKVEIEHNVTVRVVYYFRFTNTLTSSLVELGVANPVAIAWELVPLSFVADWFLNVSDFLYQFGTFMGKSFLCGSQSISDVGQATRSVSLGNVVMPTPRYATVFEVSDSGFHSRKSYSRSPLNEPPNVGLAFDNGLNTMRVVDAVSLMRQLMR